MSPEPRNTIALGIGAKQVLCGEFVGSIFKNVNRLLDEKHHSDMVEELRHGLGMKYNNIVDFAVCEVFGVKYREAFSEYAKWTGPELSRCRWCTRAEKANIDQVLCELILAGIPRCSTKKDYLAVLNEWRTRAGTKLEYDAALTVTPDPIASKADKASSKVEVTVGPTGKRRVKIR